MSFVIFASQNTSSGRQPIDLFDNKTANVGSISQIQLPENDEVINQTRTPMEAFRDVAGAFAGTLQKTAAGLGEVGQYIGDNPLTRAINQRIPESLKTKYFDPSVNIREVAGLGQDNPIDLQKIIQSDNPDAGATMVGNFLPGVASGGTSLIGQAISNTAFDALQTSPDQQNLGGILPQGKVGQAIESGTVNLALAGLGKGIPKLIDVLKPVNPKGLIASTQLAHDAENAAISKGYKEIKNELIKRNVRRIPLNDETKQLIGNALDYFPKDEDLIK